MIIHPMVLNLSSVSSSQIQILSKGLKYTPTKQIYLPEMEKDIKDFIENFEFLESQNFFAEP